MKVSIVKESFGATSKNLFSTCKDPSFAGAINCLETFYFSFHNKDLSLLCEIWYPDKKVQLNNPVGGIIQGVTGINNLYNKIFSGDVNVQVEFTNIIAYSAGNMTVFAGEEIGSYRQGSEIILLKIRTSRAFCFSEGLQRWYQFHHHGSIDNAINLAAYQKVIFQKI